MMKDKLFRLKCLLLGIKPKPVFLSIKEIQKIMRNDDYMPTAIFSADKQDYIVKPRTIYCSKRKSKLKIKI